jgi:hypothetical protein
MALILSLRVERLEGGKYGSDRAIRQWPAEVSVHMSKLACKVVINPTVKIEILRL